MEAPAPRLSERYLLNPEIPPTKSTPIFAIPKDLLLYIFRLLEAQDKARFAKVCHKWRTALKPKERFHRAQFTARYNVVKCCFGVESSSDLLIRAQKYIDHPEFCLELEIPSHEVSNRSKTTIEKIFYGLFRPCFNKDDLLVDMQHRLETSCHKNPLTFFDVRLQQLRIETEDPWELQAYRDCLLPLLKTRILYYQHDLTSLNLLFSKYTVTLFNLIGEVAVQSYQRQEIFFWFDSSTTSNTAQLSFLNRALPTNGYLKKIGFTEHPNTNFSWIAGKGLAALKTGLVRAKNINCLHFKNLNNRLDAANGNALADIIMSRQIRHPSHPFTRIVIGNQSITPDGLKAFIAGLQSYPVEIVIYVMLSGNTLELSDDFTEELCKGNQMLDLRFITHQLGINFSIRNYL